MKRPYVVISLILTLITISASAVLYPELPDRIPVHWNVHGQVDDYGTRNTIFILPGILLFMNLLFFVALPWLSPRSFKLDSFPKTYDFVIFLVIALLCYIHLLILYASWSGIMHIDRALMGGLFLFFALLGNVLGKVRRNFWIGVRTPWTLANERVWNETHRFAGKLFVAAGFVGLLVTIAGLSPIVAVFIIGIVALWSISYSLYLYKRLERRGEI